MTYVVYSAPASEPVSVAEVKHFCRIDEVNQEPAPGALTVALGSGAGNVDNGVHRYVVTFVTSDGETQAGDVSSSVTVADKTVNGKVSLSAIPVGGSIVTSRKIYRTAAGGSTYLLLTTIADNTTTTYADNTADSSLGAEAPSTNTTGDQLLNVLIKSARQYAEQLLGRYLITQTVDLYLDEFPTQAINMRPLQSVTEITYVDTAGDTQTLSAADYIVDSTGSPARITPAYGVSWPSTRDQVNAVKVRFVAGYGSASAVPQCVRNWMLMRIKQLYDQRDMINVGNIVTEFPQAYVDGLLDPERAWSKY
ncbi:MAG: hypothetical protein IPI17_02415 [Nitrosomonas sp.]|nr:hypothetical protein [Nitrosomonas sp.]MBP9872100.1 hypothetical protein [Nitrosomonas sp.]